MATTIKAYNAYLDGSDRQLFAFRIGVERMPAIVPMQPSPAYIPPS
jgi:hypothetical protein